MRLFSITWPSDDVCASSKGAADVTSMIERGVTKKKGYEITGHHEIMVPLLVWAVISALEG